MLVKIFPSVYINPDEVVFMIPYGSAFSKSRYKEAKDKGLLIDLTKRRVVKSIIELKNGSLIASPYLTDTMMSKVYSAKKERPQ